MAGAGTAHPASRPPPPPATVLKKTTSFRALTRSRDLAAADISAVPSISRCMRSMHLHSKENHATRQAFFRYLGYRPYHYVGAEAPSAQDIGADWRALIGAVSWRR